MVEYVKPYVKDCEYKTRIIDVLHDKIASRDKTIRENNRRIALLADADLISQLEDQNRTLRKTLLNKDAEISSERKQKHLAIANASAKDLEIKKLKNEA